MSATRKEVLRDLMFLFDNYAVGGNRTHGETKAYREAIRLYVDEQLDIAKKDGYKEGLAEGQHIFRGLTLLRKITHKLRRWWILRTTHQRVDIDQTRSEIIARWNHGICPDDGEEWSCLYRTIVDPCPGIKWDPPVTNSIGGPGGYFYRSDASMCCDGILEWFPHWVTHTKPDVRIYHPSYREVHEKKGITDMLYSDTPPEIINKRRLEVLGVQWRPFE